MERITRRGVQGLEALKVHPVVDIARVGATAPILQHPERAELLEMVRDRIRRQVERLDELPSPQVAQRQQAHDHQPCFVGERTKEPCHLPWCHWG